MFYNQEVISCSTITFTGPKLKHVKLAVENEDWFDNILRAFILLLRGDCGDVYSCLFCC